MTDTKRGRIKNSAPTFWITSIRDDANETAESALARMINLVGAYGLSDRTGGRIAIKPNDWICFYETKKGVIGHARITSAPVRSQDPRIRSSSLYPWTFCLDSGKLYFENPVVFDDELRTRLDANISSGWGWFVMGTHGLSKHDFKVLTRQ